jgi:hypothetical protein
MPSAADIEIAHKKRRRTLAAVCERLLTAATVPYAASKSTKNCKVHDAETTERCGEMLISIS